MIKNLFLTILIIAPFLGYCQNDFESLSYHSEISDVQPMTGIVLWHSSSYNSSDAVSLEFSYMLFKDVVVDSGVYNWTTVDSLLDEISNRKHQAILRFRYTYPGEKTSIPKYITEQNDYTTTIALSEGRETEFPDWTNAELQRFSLEFYTKFSTRYDSDPRLAFIQVGFGLWSEYHIYDGPFELGKTFPSKTYQETFIKHLDTTFTITPWSISIDAADNTYSPFEETPALKEIKFGLFDDSFMHGDHGGYNTSCWNFFNRDRYLSSPAGGEFSYYSTYDQTHVLDVPDGPYGTPFKTFAKNFHISYMIGNDQPSYQTMERIKEASMETGYRFKIERIQTKSDSCIITIKNIGVAPIYKDAYLSVNGERATKSLKGLVGDEVLVCHFSLDASGASINIESDFIDSQQEIQFYGTQEITGLKQNSNTPLPNVFPNPVIKGNVTYLNNPLTEPCKYTIYNTSGQHLYSGKLSTGINELQTSCLTTGTYLIHLKGVTVHKYTKLIIH